ncbi:MAG: hypothetical protein ACOVQN_01225 [Exiguobacterium sp.]
MQKFNEFIDTVAGGDYETIFGEFIVKISAKESAKEKAERLLDLLSSWKPLRKIIAGIKTACKHLPTFNKRQMVSIVRASGFSRETIGLLGWEIGPEGTIQLFFVASCLHRLYYSLLQLGLLLGSIWKKLGLAAQFLDLNLITKSPWS